MLSNLTILFFNLDFYAVGYFISNIFFSARKTIQPNSTSGYNTALASFVNLTLLLSMVFSSFIAWPAFISSIFFFSIAANIAAIFIGDLPELNFYPQKKQKKFVFDKKNQIVLQADLVKQEPENMELSADKKVEKIRAFNKKITTRSKIKVFLDFFSQFSLIATILLGPFFAINTLFTLVLCGSLIAQLPWILEVIFSFAENLLPSLKAMFQKTLVIADMLDRLFFKISLVTLCSAVIYYLGWAIGVPLVGGFALYAYSFHSKIFGHFQWSLADKFLSYFLKRHLKNNPNDFNESYRQSLSDWLEDGPSHAKKIIISDIQDFDDSLQSFYLNGSDFLDSCLESSKSLGDKKYNDHLSLNIRTMASFSFYQRCKQGSYSESLDSEAKKGSENFENYLRSVGVSDATQRKKFADDFFQGQTAEKEAKISAIIAIANMIDRHNLKIKKPMSFDSIGSHVFTSIDEFYDTIFDHSYLHNLASLVFQSPSLQQKIEKPKKASCNSCHRDFLDRVEEFNQNYMRSIAYYFTRIPLTKIICQSEAFPSFLTLQNEFDTKFDNYIMSLESGNDSLSSFYKSELESFMSRIVGTFSELDLNSGYVRTAKTFELKTGQELFIFSFCEQLKILPEYWADLSSKLFNSLLLLHSYGEGEKELKDYFNSLKEIRISEGDGDLEDCKIKIMYSFNKLPLRSKEVLERIALDNYYSYPCFTTYNTKLKLATQSGNFETFFSRYSFSSAIKYLKMRKDLGSFWHKTDVKKGQLFHDKDLTYFFLSSILFDAFSYVISVVYAIFDYLQKLCESMFLTKLILDFFGLHSHNEFFEISSDLDHVTGVIPTVNLLGLKDVETFENNYANRSTSLNAFDHYFLANFNSSELIDTFLGTCLQNLKIQPWSELPEPEKVAADFNHLLTHLNRIKNNSDLVLPKNLSLLLIQKDFWELFYKEKDSDINSIEQSIKALLRTICMTFLVNQEYLSLHKEYPEITDKKAFYSYVQSDSRISIKSELVECIDEKFAKPELVGKQLPRCLTLLFGTAFLGAARIYTNRNNPKLFGR